jgi:hypothetical protein
LHKEEKDINKSSKKKVDLGEQYKDKIIKDQELKRKLSVVQNKKIIAK